MAVTFHIGSRPLDSLPWYEAAVQTAVSTGDEDNRAIALTNMGDVLMTAGRLHEASEVLRRGVMAMSHMTRSETAARVIWTYAVAIGAFYGIVAVFTLFLARRFGVGEKTIGYFVMWFGAAGVIVRTTLVGPVVSRFGEVRMAVGGLVLLGAGLILFPFSRGYPLLLTAMTLMPLGTAFTFPAVTALLSRVVPSKERGLYMGVQQTVGGVSRVVFPWWDGWAFDHIGMAAPFVVCGALTLGTVGLIRGIAAPARAQGSPEPRLPTPDVAPGAAPPQTSTPPDAKDRVGSGISR